MKKNLVIIAAAVWWSTASFCISADVYAGDLEPTGPPAPTMKTLNEIPPTWSQALPGSERFVQVLEDNFLVIGDEAILDQETGLVWERSPETASGGYSWSDALSHCYTLKKGGRKGWHLPTIDQLASLADDSNSFPALPDGHPFDAPLVAWSSTTNEANPNEAWRLSIQTGVVEHQLKALQSVAWCVRGGMR